MIHIPRGSTSVILRLNLGETGLTFESADLSISTICDNEATAVVYTEATSTLENVTTIGTYATPTASKARFRAVDAVNHPGLYEIHLPNARFAVTNSRYLIVHALFGLTGSQHIIDLTPLVAVSPIISPVAGNAPERIQETTIRTFSGETYTAQVSGLDAEGEVIDWTALGALEFVVEDERKTDVLLINNDLITKASTYFEVAIPASINVANQRYKWAIRQVTNDIVVLYGNLVVAYAAEAAPTE